MDTTFLLRFGELTLKSRPVRKQMVTRLIANLQRILQQRKIPHRIKRQWARVLLLTSEPEPTKQILSQVFGLRSFSMITRSPCCDHAQLIDLATSFFSSRVANKRFAVRAHRDKSSTFSTRQIERELGTALLPMSKGVDLTSPDITCFVDIRDSELILYEDKNNAPGGLPLGTEQPALSLISGGFDSPVATWLALRRGIPCDFLFFELGGLAHRKPIYEHLQHLYSQWCFGYKPKLFVIQGSPVISALQQSIPPKYWNVMLKRIFYRVGELLAQKHQYFALITGEVIAQVSSQTLSNLYSISHGISIPILRPLLTYEKDDIVALARQIGSHDISLGVREYCAISHHSPATRSNVQQILNFENMLNSNGFYASLIDQLEQLDVEALTPEQIQYLQVVTDQIPPQAVIIDMRETSELHWSIPQPSIALSLSELIDRPEQLSADQTYLLVCEFGTQSIEIAYMLREMGYQTYAFDGGISKLQNFYKAHTDHKNFK